MVPTVAQTVVPNMAGMALPIVVLQVPSVAARAVVEASVTPVEALTVTVILSFAAAPSPHRAVATESRCKTMPAEEKSGALKPKTGAECNMGVDMAQCMK